MLRGDSFRVSLSRTANQKPNVRIVSEINLKTSIFFVCFVNSNPDCSHVWENEPVFVPVPGNVAKKLLLISVGRLVERFRQAIRTTECASVDFVGYRICVN